jgi:hypothetical protein
MDLYFIKLADGGLYATGPHPSDDGRRLAGGPMAYLRRREAATMAEALGDGSEIEARSLNYALDWCRKRGYTLYIRDGSSVTAAPLPGNEEGAGHEGLAHLDA